MSQKNFQKVKKLGQGSFGKVYKVKRLFDNQYYAMKKINLLEMREKEKLNSLNQIRLLASINHPNIISYKQAFFDQDTNYLCLVMELASNGDLAYLIEEKRKKRKYFSEYEVWQIGAGILKGLQTLHKNKIIHRDLKPANVFFNSQNQAKLGDLNVSKLLQGNMAFTQVGTPCYASPQVWNNEPYSYDCDIWSFGCILYQICCLRNPFKDKNASKVYQKIRKLKYEPIPLRFTQKLSETIKKCLKNRHQRITLYQLNKIFQKYLPIQGQKKATSKNNILLNTLTMPQNKKQLKIIFPRQKYTQIQEQLNPQSNIVENFFQKTIGLSKQKRNKKLSITSSQKYLKNTPSKKILQHTPSFKNVFIPTQQIPHYEKYSLYRLNLKRRKLRMANNF